MEQSGNLVKNTPSSSALSKQAEIDFFALFSRLSKKRKVISLATIGAAIVFFLVSLILDDTYRSNAILAPAMEGGSGQYLSLASNFGALDALAGLGLGEGNDENTQAYALLTSRVFITKFINAENLKPILFEGRWNEEGQSWQPRGVLFKLGSFLKGGVLPEGMRDSDEPTDGEAYKIFLKKCLSVKKDSKTDLITLSIESNSPDLSKHWLTQIIQRINDHIRTEKKIEAEQSNKFLRDELKRTQIAEIRNNIFQLIQANTQTIMLTNTRNEFAFKIIDPPSMPEENASPNRLMFGVLGAVLGLMLSSISVLNNSQEKK